MARIQINHVQNACDKFNKVSHLNWFVYCCHVLAIISTFVHTRYDWGMCSIRPEIFVPLPFALTNWIAPLAFYSDPLDQWKQQHQRIFSVWSGGSDGILWSTLSRLQIFRYQATAVRILQSSSVNRFSIDSVRKGDGKFKCSHRYGLVINFSFFLSLHLDNNESGRFVGFPVPTRWNRMQC